MIGTRRRMTVTSEITLSQFKLTHQLCLQGSCLDNQVLRYQLGNGSGRSCAAVQKGGEERLESIRGQRLGIAYNVLDELQRL